jgi:hypothetical protein
MSWHLVLSDAKVICSTRSFLSQLQYQRVPIGTEFWFLVGPSVMKIPVFFFFVPWKSTYTTGFLNNLVETDTTFLYKYGDAKQQRNAAKKLVDAKHQNLVILSVFYVIPQQCWTVCILQVLFHSQLSIWVYFGGKKMRTQNGWVLI